MVLPLVHALGGEEATAMAAAIDLVTGLEVAIEGCEIDLVGVHGGAVLVASVSFDLCLHETKDKHAIDVQITS